MAKEIGHQVAVNIGYGFSHHGHITKVNHTQGTVEVALETGEIRVVPSGMVKARRGRPKTLKGLQTTKRVNPLSLSTRHMDNESMSEMAFEIRANFEPSDAEEMIKRYCR